MVREDSKFLDIPGRDNDLFDLLVDNDELIMITDTSNENFNETFDNDASTSAVSEGASTSWQHQGNDEDEEDKQNELVQAILQAQQIPRNHPPPIILEDTVMDICFNPESDTIAVASVTGDIFLYKYSCEETSLISTIEIHLKACRDVEFSNDGRSLFSTGKDLCIAMTDMETEKLIRLYEKAHEQPIYSMTIINENVFATGDDDGVVKLWDLRRRETEPVFSIKKVEDHISAMITNREAKYLVCASGDGCLTTINIPERQMHVQSEEYDDEFTCLGLFKSERKLLSASNMGKMYVFNWGEFGLHSDEFPSATKKAINCMVPITENIVITGGEDGILRATSLFPHLQLGIVGQHNFSVEVLDISNDGTLVASASHDNDIKFWNVQYFETLDVTETVKGGRREQLAHNLPSSEVNNRADFFAEL
ncbi:WD repeat-containing protein 55 homolog [Ooceraea biroi]|uniref:WD repeat-containing protein 55 homolog n=1 Tax=Ooceraea biroi TaxID=2015173 RepID=A0A026VVI1_OOCBI|nr:WD repeat-containing protein 55 homolog [Ooceraea biroi]EZA46839.1 WD repeat-containing protein 55-like protein [Ooceraea biroi]